MHPSQAARQVSELLHGLEPVAIILVGPPGCGKSTFRDALRVDHPELVVLSSDDAVETYAKAHNLTYSEAFHKVDQKLVNRHLNELLTEARLNGLSVIVDRTNMSKKSRRTWIEPLAKHVKVGLNFKTLDHVLKERLETRAAREGKVIPEYVLRSMLSSFQPLTKDEGFSVILDIDS